MRIECYHMETRTSGSGKNRRTRRVRVVTWRGSREIQYATWYDQSQRPAGLDQFPVIKMLCKKTPITFILDMGPCSSYPIHRLELHPCLCIDIAHAIAIHPRFFEQTVAKWFLSAF